MTPNIDTIVNGPFQENSYLVFDPESLDAILIDPGDEPERIAAHVTKRGLRLVGIFNTHGHMDHAGAVAALKRRFAVPFAIHTRDRFLLESISDQARMFGLGPLEPPTVDRELADGEAIIVGRYPGKVIHTPGHTPGGVCFLFGEALFSGDTLFAGSVGRTDLPGGSTAELLRSIRSRLLILDDRITVYAGHGPETTIGAERRGNPFLM